MESEADRTPKLKSNSNNASTTNSILFHANLAALWFWAVANAASISEGWYSPKNIFLYDCVIFAIAMFDVVYLTGPDGFKESTRHVKWITQVWGFFALINAMIYSSAIAGALD